MGMPHVWVMQTVMESTIRRYVALMVGIVKTSTRHTLIAMLVFHYLLAMDYVMGGHITRQNVAMMEMTALNAWWLILLVLAMERVMGVFTTQWHVDMMEVTVQTVL